MSAVTETTDTQIAVIDEQNIKDKIYIIRGQQVMLDFELAEIYGYTTKAFNQQVKRNIDRFPDDFMFELTADETNEFSRSQNVTLKKERGSNIKYCPHAFTEQGIYMLMTVLNGKTATIQSKALIRTFKKLKDYFISTKPLIEDKGIQALALRTMENSNEISAIKNTISNIENEMLKKSDLPEIIRSFGLSKTESQYLILNGETVEARLAYMQIYKHAGSAIYIIDNYIGLKTLHLLKDISPSVNITIFSDNINSGLTKNEYTDFHKEYPAINISFKQTKGVFHDRFIITDFNTSDERIFHCGASSKDAGKRVTAIAELSERSCYTPLINGLLNNPPLILK